jgi:glycosyltransferase involved in cell wall biosynthesis
MPNSTPHDAPPTAAPAIAAIIPFYNGSAFIERALRSIYAQSLPAAEVIVVNDGSRDDEREFLHRIQPQYGFTLIDQPNGGQGAARNAGVAAASAPYICFLDQDDFWLEHHNRILAAAIPPDDPRWGYVYGNLWEADIKGRTVTRAMIKNVDQHPKLDVFDMVRNDIWVLPSATLLRREAFEAVGGFDTQFTGYEDDDMFLRIFRAGYTSHFVNRAVLVWCTHTGSTSYTMRMSQSRLKYFKKLAVEFPDEPRRNSHFLRDCLMPRFGPYFMGQALQTTRANAENRAEARAILDEYAALVLPNPFIGPRSKLKLRIVLTLVHDCPHWLLRLVTSGPVIRLPKMTWLRQLLTMTI